MSEALDVAARVHQSQLEAVKRGQDAVLSALEQLHKLAGSNLPSMPTSEPAAKVMSMVGQPADFIRHSARSTADWAKVSEEFQNRLAAIVESDTDADQA